MTNADRIRNATDEELARLMDNSLDYFNCDICEYRKPHCNGDDGGCIKHILKWLKEEVKKKMVKHTFEFETEEDWKPMTPTCWVGCPFSFMIGLGNSCKCLDGKAECPFVGKIND